MTATNATTTITLTLTEEEYETLQGSLRLCHRYVDKTMRDKNPRFPNLWMEKRQERLSALLTRLQGAHDAFPI